MQNILVLNSGSSSVKLKVINLLSDTEIFELQLTDVGTTLTHEAALNNAIDKLSEYMADKPISLDAVAHRLVHGGEKFVAPTLITRDIFHEIEKLIHLAPLHLPGNLLGIKVCRKTFPDVPQVAIFDTAFHKDLPDYAYLYPIPKKWEKEYGIRKYGFHGTSHSYLATTAAQLLNKPLEALNLITLHLGNGASLCAIRAGRSVDTSMGFTPAAGLMMGTRSGDLDPIIPLCVQQKSGMEPDEVEIQLNFESGLQAVCDSHDMRHIISRMHDGDLDAKLAVEMFVYRIRKAIGAYMVILGHVDAIIFSGGIGEKSAELRARCCENLERYGVCLDTIKNNIQEVDGWAEISQLSSVTKIFIIESNEEYQLAKQAGEYLAGLDIST